MIGTAAAKHGTTAAINSTAAAINSTAAAINGGRPAIATTAPRDKGSAALVAYARSVQDFA
eukprot:2937618-Rhodomonas_salina.4